MRKTFKYRLFPTKAQKRQLNAVLRDCCWVYNQCLEERKTAWEQEQRSVTCYDQHKKLPELKESRPTLKQVHSQVLQDVPKRLDRSFQDFFRRVKHGETPGFPRFRPYQRYDSITFPQVPSGCRLTDDGCLALSKIGSVPIKLHRPLEGIPKTATVKRTPTGKWFVSFSCEWEPTALPPNDDKIGIDMGVRIFAALSNGDKIENPQFFKTEQKALAKAQRNLAKQTKGTKERAHARKAVSRIYERLAWQRDNFAHQESRKLVDRYGTIIVEALNIKKLLEKPDSCSSKKRGIADAAWRQFLTLLSVKAEWAARTFVAVNPAYTSRTCSACGHRGEDQGSALTFTCPRCSHSEHRDTNAAKNIFALGTQCMGAHHPLEAPAF